METAVVLLNFGEPSEPDRDVVLEYLTRIFYDNASLEDAESEEAARERSRELAKRRLPGLMEEYEEIGGSPLQEQATAQAEALAETLDDRGHDVSVYHAMQFMEPLIPDVAKQLAEAEFESVLAVPIYPLCGPSTSVAAIDALEAAIDDLAYDPEFASITGWHRTPTYNRIRAEAIREFVAEEGIDLADPDTAFVFSAHGTPTKYLEEGSRYDGYVEGHADALANIIGLEEYEIGYQNHENRGIEWTEPETEDVVEELGGEAERVVVEPMSFMHEQSETLVELDIDLEEDADAVGLDLYRVPVPHDDPRFPGLLADLVEPFLSGFEPDYYQLRQCQCRDEPGTYCMNAGLPPQ
ncbi:ferrochelatase [Natronobacterium gregoryi]|uniref:Ferrochelatase n=2 Tax=Natronobacterium gregoryi TaxID=44930 RepID=L0ALE1_NATGS|nr:ferrochelatase [Natronobacterium gregoryi]AFZ74269.1 ferrochelatase [Natronobacterium gregoryi SP2]ELY63727.1 Ferrochelatase [Natronobacterium gregoryi SP2]PLK21948.1 ferrochelatase [Natronobacterium gregoryi SP2]SFI52703.1 ferrochelatase [Natronobacterium gregoryi]